MTLRETVLSGLTLFGSVSTLLCCALPALLVSLGAGAVMAGLVSAIPQLVWVSQHKVGLFIFAGVMLTVSAISRYMTRNAPCPVDPLQAKSCLRMRNATFIVFCFSFTLYLIGFFFAFVAPFLLR